MTASMQGVRVWLALAALALLAACTDTAGPVSRSAPEPLGDFKLGYAVVVAKNAQKGPLSREATPEEWVALIKPKLERMYRPLQGDRFYHISVSVDGYVLAVPGVPVIASPKSMLVVSLNVWDDERGKLVLEPNKRFTIIEAISGKSILGSGLTRTKEEQMQVLVDQALKRIDAYLRENADAFRPDSPTFEPTTGS